MKRLATLALLLVACSFGFDSPSQVKDRRILAIAAEPPELVLSAPPAGLHVSALVVEPKDGDPSAPFTWTSCVVPANLPRTGNLGGQGGFAPTSASRCADQTLTMVASSGDVPLGELQSDVALSPALGGALHLGAEGRPLALQLELQVGEDAGALFAVKTVDVVAQAPDGEEANRNPVLAGLALDGVEWPEDGGLSLGFDSCPADQRQTMRNGPRSSTSFCTHELLPLFDAGVAQAFGTTDSTGATVSRHEVLSFSWFGDDGSFERDTTSFDVDHLSPVFRPGGDGGYAAKWHEPASAPGTVTFWVVVRDGRGGSSWQKRHLTLR